MGSTRDAPIVSAAGSSRRRPTGRRSGAETNVRILGVCGAGGIGFLISDKIQSYELREVCTVMILIIAAVTVIDLVCGRLMQRFI